jgi:DNA-binding response OmpR family regulator
MDFLSALACHKIVSYEEIALLWADSCPSENAIRSYIKHLRKKLPHDFLKNRNGVGYFIESDE